MKLETQNSLAKTDEMILDDESVAAYLTEHPDFFTNREELLLKLRIPHKSGSAVSLLERQVSLLRRKSDENQNKIHDFIENAKENDDLFEKTRTIILNIINTRSLEELSDLIDEKLKNEFDATASRIFFATTETVDEQESKLFMLPLDHTRKVLGVLFQRKRAYCGNLDNEQAQLFFPDTVKINSAAIIPIHFHDEKELKGKLPGIPLLVIASSKAKHFNSSLDTLFLDFIGEILSAQIKGLLLK